MAYSVRAYFVASFFYNPNAILLFVTGYFCVVVKHCKMIPLFFLNAGNMILSFISLL